MQRAFNKTTVLALLGTLLSAGALGAAPARASTGGASAGGLAVPGPAAPPLHRLSHGASIATWFGPGFYGQRTACGQLLTPAVVGVAHRTLPCGTLVSVRYRGRRLTLPVIDRGPYRNGAEWDLTSEAARAPAIADTVRVTARVV